MTDPATPTHDANPVPSDERAPAPPDVAVALSQMAGLVLSRETVDTRSRVRRSGTLWPAVTTTD